MIIPPYRPGISAGKILAAGLKTACFWDFPGAVTGLERSFARYLGTKHAVLVSSGRSALWLILKSLDLKRGAEVIIPAFTYWAVPEAVKALNLQPVYADVDYSSGVIDPAELEKKITSRTAAVIPTHLCGQPCDMDSITRICRGRGIALIEDCAQSFGASYKSRKLGSISCASYFSLGVTKSLFMLGLGMIATDNAVSAEKIRGIMEKSGIFKKSTAAKRFVSSLAVAFMGQPVCIIPFYAGLRLAGDFAQALEQIVFAEKKKPFDPARENKMPPGPVSLDYLWQTQIPDMDAAVQKRIKIGRFYLENLKPAGGICSLPAYSEDHAFTSFAVRTALRSELKALLLKKGVIASAGYMDAFGEDCERARRLSSDILHLPCYSSMTWKELSYTARVFNESVAVLKGS